MMRSTTGRKLVEVQQARMSGGKKTVETDRGVEFEIDLGGGVVEKVAASSSRAPSLMNS